MMIAAKVYLATGIALVSAAEQIWMSRCHRCGVTTLLTDPAQWMTELPGQQVESSSIEGWSAPAGQDHLDLVECVAVELIEIVDM